MVRNCGLFAVVEPSMNETHERVEVRANRWAAYGFHSVSPYLIRCYLS